MIRNHGIHDTTIDNAFNTSKAFYDLPLADKEEVKVSEEYAYG